MFHAKFPFVILIEDEKILPENTMINNFIDAKE